MKLCIQKGSRLLILTIVNDEHNLQKGKDALLRGSIVHVVIILQTTETLPVSGLSKVTIFFIFKSF